MKCLIIAAGQGTRLAGKGDSKPLVPLGGKPLIEHVILNALNANVSEFYIVTGYNGDKIRQHLKDFSKFYPVKIQFIRNDEWEKPNGISVLCAREHLREPFFLLMSDHLFDSSIMVDLNREGVGNGEVKLAVDKRIDNNPLIDIDDVTKVLTDNGHIRDIGKTIPNYNAFDTGMFLCTPALFNALNDSIIEGNYSLSAGILKMAGRHKARVFDIGNRNWIDVDDEAAFARAEKIFAHQRKN